MIRVDVYLEDPAAILAVGAFGAGALIRIESASAVGGPFTEIGTIAVTTTQVQPFTYWDSAGAASSWYRWRVSNSGNTVFSPYSAAFQGTSPTDVASSDSYATLGDLMPLFKTKPGASQYARLNALLRTATAEIIEELTGRDYFRHPASGTESWYVDLATLRRRGEDPSIAHVHDGIVSIDTLELSDDGGSTFSTITAGDYYLRGSDPASDASMPAGEPAFHLVFTGLGSQTTFPRGRRVGRFTGARGWPAVPRLLREGTAQRARQLAYADPSFEGVVPAMDEMGRPTVSHRWPDVLYTFLANERQRFWCHV